MAVVFEIKPGIYNVPNVGRVDATKPLDESIQYELYKSGRKVFPFARWTDRSLKYLKSVKPSDKEVGRMINHAVTVEEVEELKKLSRKRAVKLLAETRLQILNSTLP